MIETPRSISLQTPDLSDENILGFNVGIRPYRKTGIRIETEYLKNKLLVHNYGYGGSGLTLSWGGAHEVLRLLEVESSNFDCSKQQTIAVLGAGVIGLATAYELLQLGYQVNIYAGKFSPFVTSNVAAGILSAPMISPEMNSAEIAFLNKMLDISISRFLLCTENKTPEFLGVKFLNDYRVENFSKKDKFKHIGFQEQKVLINFSNGKIKEALEIRELALDGKIYLENLFSKVKILGGNFFTRFFSDISEINNLSEKIIINCTSFGSRELFGDKYLIPIRGHLIYFKPQGGIDYSFYQALPGQEKFWVKIFPWHDRFILGGVFEDGEEECTLSKEILQTLLKHARECFA